MYKILLIFIIQISLFAFESKSYNLSSLTNNQYIGKNLHFLEDKKGIYTFEDIVKGKYDKEFFFLDSPAPLLENIKSIYWAKFSLTNSSDTIKKVVLEQENMQLRKLDLYYKVNGNWQKTTKGFNESYHSDHTRIYFNLEIPPKTTLDYIVRMESSFTTFDIRFKLWEKESFDEHKSQMLVIVGLFNGILIALMIYNLYLFFATKDRNFLLYVIYMVVYTLAQLSYIGYGQKVVWYGNEFFNEYFYLSGWALSLLIYTIFAYSFLEINKYLKSQKYIIFTIAILFLLLRATCKFHHHKLVNL